MVATPGGMSGWQYRTVDGGPTWRAVRFRSGHFDSRARNRVALESWISGFSVKTRLGRWNFALDAMKGDLGHLRTGQRLSIALNLERSAWRHPEEVSWASS